MSTLTANALKVLQTRYLLKDKEATIFETPAELFRRVAKEIAASELENGSVIDAEYWEEQFYELMSGLYFLPNSPSRKAFPSNSASSLNVPIPLRAIFALYFLRNFLIWSTSSNIAASCSAIPPQKFTARIKRNVALRNSSCF